MLFTVTIRKYISLPFFPWYSIKTGTYLDHKRKLSHVPNNHPEKYPEIFLLIIKLCCTHLRTCYPEMILKPELETQVRSVLSYFSWDKKKFFLPWKTFNIFFNFFSLHSVHTSSKNISNHCFFAHTFLQTR